MSRFGRSLDKCFRFRALLPLFTLSMPGGLDHCSKHAAAAVVTFVLTLFLADVLRECFGERNVTAPRRKKIGTRLGRAEERRRSLGAAVRAPWEEQLTRAP